VTGGRQFFGNPDLRRALLRHVDLRWEWFPTSGELVSVGVFYKHFKDPIEMVLVPSAQLSVTYANAAAAQNLGLELEFRKNLAFLDTSLRDLYVASNVALIASSVDIGDAETIQTNKQRPLQGQAPYVLNLQIGYENADTGTNAALLYNVSGRRIDEVGALGAPDTYIEAFHQLDLVLGLRLPNRFELNLRAQNLLDLPLETRQGTALVERDLRGRVFSLAVARNF
jgi:outer membrane receptor protein involved in Fe transport